MGSGKYDYILIITSTHITSNSTLQFSRLPSPYITIVILLIPKYLQFASIHLHQLIQLTSLRHIFINLPVLLVPLLSGTIETEEHQIESIFQYLCLSVSPFIRLSVYPINRIKTLPDLLNLTQSTCVTPQLRSFAVVGSVNWGKHTHNNQPHGRKHLCHGNNSK